MSGLMALNGEEVKSFGINLLIIIGVLDGGWTLF
jgi:hypothetical protein